MTTPPIGVTVVIERSMLDGLMAGLARRGFEVVGPTVREGAVVLDTIKTTEDLPLGCGDEQDCGQYRLKKRAGRSLFGYNLGPQSWKKYFHPPELRLLAAERRNGVFQVLPPPPQSRKLALIGVRACELAALAALDRVFLGDRYVDPGYRARRQGTFVVAVNCTQAARTCFCASTGTGPRVKTGFDLAITELEHALLVEVGTGAGAELVADVGFREPAPDEIVPPEPPMARSLETEGVRELLYESFDDPRWDRIAARCLSCGNCTQVCPTCFCTTTEEASDVGGTHAERWRRWDSCFTESFSYIHGGSVRLSIKSRYRQWLTHKLAAWQDQFGMLGCVGCGRCITWCPGKIDLTEEVRALRGAVGRT